MRTLIDIRLMQADTASGPAVSALNAIVAAGGRVVYRFHGPMVRAELDVAALPRIAVINSAATVADTATHQVTLIVMLSHSLTDADISAVEALGGLVTRRFDTLAGYVVTIDDSQVAAVRALPGVSLAGFDATACLD